LVLTISAVLHNFASFVEVEYFNNQNALTAVFPIFLFAHGQNRHYFYFLSEICCHRRSQLHKSIEIVILYCLYTWYLGRLLSNVFDDVEW